MIDGKKITLGGREFIMPPAPFGVVRRFKEVFEGREAADVTKMGDIVFAALQRNYPDMSQQEFEDKYLDLGNIRDAFQAIMGASGAEQAEPGEA